MGSFSSAASETEVAVKAKCDASEFCIRREQSKLCKLRALEKCLLGAY